MLRRESPIFKKGLSLAQRLNYISSMFTYFESFQRLMYTVTPAIVLITALLPINVGITAFLIRFLPYFILGQAANIALGRGHFKVLETDRFNLLKMTTFIKATFVLLGFDPTAARRNIEPGDRTYSCLDQCIEVAMGSIIPTTAVSHLRLRRKLPARKVWSGPFCALTMF